VAQADPPAPTLAHGQWDPAVSEALHVAGDGSIGDTEMLGQVSNLDPLTAGGIESFDQCLLAFDPPQGEMPISGGSCEPDSCVHGNHRKEDIGLSGLFRTVSR
jgi:hypothetical protein